MSHYEYSPRPQSFISLFTLPPSKLHQVQPQSRHSRRQCTRTDLTASRIPYRRLAKVSRASGAGLVSVPCLMPFLLRVARLCAGPSFLGTLTRACSIYESFASTTFYRLIDNPLANMRESNYSFPAQNRAVVGLSQLIYDRRGKSRFICCAGGH